MDWKKHLINENSSIKEALISFDALAKDALLFVVDEHYKLIGSLTDGDVRRGIIKGSSISDLASLVANKNPKFIVEDGDLSLEKLIEFRSKNYGIIPILNKKKQLVNVLNFSQTKSRLPIEAVIMAGGKGERLKPLTDTIPKPLLLVGNLPILEHNLNSLLTYGIKKTYLSVNYLSEQIIEFAKTKENSDFSIEIINEEFPMGTIGSVSLINDFSTDTVLICNSDLLTNVDLELFYLDFKKSNADLSIVTIPYTVNIPYAVLEVNEQQVINFKEKPTYTYYSNGGMYLIKKELLNHIPKNQCFYATDLMEHLINNNHVVRSFPHHGYWLDIGKHEDYKRANEDIKTLKLF